MHVLGTTFEFGGVQILRRAPSVSFLQFSQKLLHMRIDVLGTKWLLRYFYNSLKHNLNYRIFRYIAHTPNFFDIRFDYI
jgi:isoprenylcysteine carboxyl methyltransferase (ICMT) family protein YpbQ